MTMDEVYELHERCEAATKRLGRLERFNKHHFRIGGFHICYGPLAGKRGATAAMEVRLNDIRVLAANFVDGKWAHDPRWFNSHHAPHLLGLLRTALILDDLAETQ